MSKIMTDAKSELQDVKRQLTELLKSADGYLYVQPLQNRLDELDSSRVDGKFGGKSPNKKARFQTPADQVPEGQAALVALMEECYAMVHEIINSNKADRTSLQAELLEIKAELTKLKGGRKPSQAALDKLKERLSFVEMRRIDGKFLNLKGEVPSGQAVLHELLAECHELKEAVESRLA